MTLPQTQKPTAGQIVDSSRDIYRSLCWPGNLAKWTATLAAYEDGLYSFKVNNSITISFTAEPGDDATTTIEGLKINYEGSSSAYRIALPVANANVLTIYERSAGPGFTLSDAVDPGAATLTLADETPANERLPLGIAIAVNGESPNDIRLLQTGDVLARVRGITVENPLLAPSDGLASSIDGYDPGSPVTVLDKGRAYVQLEEAVANVDDPVWVRVNAPSTQTVGAFRRSDAGGGNTIQLTNCRWVALSWVDNQGNLVGELQGDFT